MFGKILIGLGFIAIPFLRLAGHRFNGREPRLMLAMFIALALSLWGFYVLKRIRVNNKWILLYLAFLFVSAWQAPQMIVTQFGINVGNFWIWKAIFLQLSFFGMWAMVSNTPFNEAEIGVFLNIMVWCGLLMALHCIGQSMGLNQWFHLDKDIQSIETTQGYIVGFLGHPTKVAPYIAMLIPLSIYLKRYWATLAMIIAVCLTLSQVAIGSMVVSLFVLIALVVRRLRAIVCTLLLACVIILSIGYVKYPATFKKYLDDQGRFGQWAMVIKDLKEPFITNKPYAWTGYGPGSFENTFRFKHKNRTLWLHNEYLENVRETGIIGFSLLIMAVLFLIKNIVWTERNKYIFASFTCIAICAGGAYVWHMGDIIYSTIFLLGLLTNKEIT